MKQYTAAEVAAEFAVSPATVRRWIRNRKLIGIRPSWAAGAYRIAARAMDVFRTQRDRPTR
jgi:predicted DNA-binding transcriptional regulator YafY